MSRKKGPSCPNWGEGGGLGDSGNARKKTFFSVDVFPNKMIKKAKNITLNRLAWEGKISTAGEKERHQGRKHAENCGFDILIEILIFK